MFLFQLLCPAYFNNLAEMQNEKLCQLTVQEDQKLKISQSVYGSKSFKKILGFNCTLQIMRKGSQYFFPVES